MRKQLYRYARLLVVVSYYLLVAFPLVVSASVTLQWDANNPTPDGYNIYQRVDGQTYNYATPLNPEQLTETSFSANNLEPGVTYYFVVRAITGMDHSGDSNEVVYMAPAAVNDSDGDGIVDLEDAFPTDPNEWVDTDSDGIGNNQDTDDDGDGMPDSYEVEIDGLNPLVNDAEGDLDGDQVSNKDEYDNGTNPAQETNYLPDTPVLSMPANQTIVSLTPTLVTDVFSDANGDNHFETRYQIAFDSNFIDLVFDRISTEDLTRLRIMDLILDPDATYYWRVKFVDDGGAESQWSAASSFTTVDYATAGDQNANGILDSQEVEDMNVDLDGDLIPDATQSNLLCVNTSDSVNPHVSVKEGSSGIEVVALRAIASEGLGHALSLNAPETLTGLISFKLYLDAGVTMASIEIYFTTEAPEGAQYYFNTGDGWVAYSGVIFSSDRKSVTITLEDGGDGDQDGVENGVIVDPAGLGYSSQIYDTGSFEATEQTSCFITTPMDDLGVGAGGGGLLTLAVIIGGLFGLAGTPLLQRQRPKPN